jgi:hypothetical protein
MTLRAMASKPQTTPKTIVARCNPPETPPIVLKSLLPSKPPKPLCLGSCSKIDPTNRAETTKNTINVIQKSATMKKPPNSRKEEGERREEATSYLTPLFSLLTPFGAGHGSRTHTVARSILSRVRLPVPPIRRDTGLTART